MVTRFLAYLYHIKNRCQSRLLPSPLTEIGSSTCDLQAGIHYAPYGTDLVGGERVWQRENGSGQKAVVECLKVIDVASISDQDILERAKRSLGGSVPGKDPVSGSPLSHAQIALLKVISPLYGETLMPQRFHYLDRPLEVGCILKKAG